MWGHVPNPLLSNSLQHDPLCHICSLNAAAHEIVMGKHPGYDKHDIWMHITLGGYIGCTKPFGCRGVELHLSKGGVWVPCPLDEQQKYLGILYHRSSSSLVCALPVSYRYPHHYPFHRVPFRYCATLVYQKVLARSGYSKNSVVASIVNVCLQSLQTLHNSWSRLYVWVICLMGIYCSLFAPVSVDWQPTYLPILHFAPTTIANKQQLTQGAVQGGKQSSILAILEHSTRVPPHLHSPHPPMYESPRPPWHPRHHSPQHHI